MALEWESQPGVQECFKGHMKPLKLWVRFCVHLLGSRNIAFFIRFTKGSLTPTNVKKLCFMAPRGLDLIDIQAQSQPAIPTGLTPNVHLPL